MHDPEDFNVGDVVLVRPGRTSLIQRPGTGRVVESEYPNYTAVVLDDPELRNPLGREGGRWAIPSDGSTTIELIQSAEATFEWPEYVTGSGILNSGWLHDGRRVEPIRIVAAFSDNDAYINAAAWAFVAEHWDRINR